MKIVHLVTQDNQPYGSTRQCCELCGNAVLMNKAAWTDDRDAFSSVRKSPGLEGYVTCDSSEAEISKVMAS